MSQTLNTPFYRATWHLAEGRKFKLPLVRKEEEEDRAMDILQNEYMDVLWIRRGKTLLSHFFMVHLL